jgi:hypothetical protein
MNDAHLHLVVNHFPIIGLLFGIGIVITGIILKNNSVKNTAYFVFIIAAIFGAFSMKTGEGAEELVENLPGIGHDIIHEHEEIAEKFILLLYATGIGAFISLIASYKNYKFSTIATYCTLALALISGFLAKNVGTTGGEIRHTEIRNEESQSNDKTIEIEEKENE